MRSDEPAPTREVPQPAARTATPGETREIVVPPVQASSIAPTRELPSAPPREVPPAPRRDTQQPPARDTQRARQSQDRPAPAVRRRQDDGRQLAQDPISKILRAIQDVAFEGLTILQFPRDFPRRLGIDDDSMFTHGTRFMLGTVPATFVLLLPIHMIHGRALSQTSVALLYTILCFVSGPLVHGALWVVRARRTPLATTIGLYSYMLGAQSLATLIMMYPTGLRLGPKIFFGAQNKAEMDALLTHLPLTDQRFIAINLLLTYIVLGIITFGGWVPLFSRYYEMKGRMRYLRTAIAVIIPLMIVGALFTRFMTQFRQAVESL